MPTPANSLTRFTEAQATAYATALAEISDGRKRSHWMWFVFPQIQGLGLSSTAQYYAIRSGQEAAAYLHHPVLGERLRAISAALLALPGGATASSIFGSPDDLKLRSCATLFATVPGAPPVFQAVLNRFFQGAPDQQTLRLLGMQP